VTDDTRIWLTVAEAREYLPLGQDKLYRMARRYLKRLEKEQLRIYPAQLRDPSAGAELLLPRAGELPCIREGRSILVSRHLLLHKLGGYLATG
jgi:hypothetical protein